MASGSARSRSTTSGSPEGEWVGFFARFASCLEKFDFKANNQGIVGEPADAKVDKDKYPDDYARVKDSVMKSSRALGQTMQYGHTGNLTYRWATSLSKLMW